VEKGSKQGTGGEAPPESSGSARDSAPPSSEARARARLAAEGAAHDLGNLLTAVFSQLELALDPELSLAERNGYVESALGALEPARALASELRALVGVPRERRAAYAVGTLVTESARLILGGSKVQARMAISEELWAGSGDALRLRRVLDNLLLNARQAMPSGGYVGISAQNVEVERGDERVPVPGRYVEIQIADDGPGIPASILKRLFVSQITTKQAGNGIGLPTCRALIEEEGGTIAVSSAMGRGATFTLLVPATAAAAGSRAEAVLKAVPSSERVLVVDDEPMVARLFQTALTQRGYQVEVARDQASALAAFARTRESTKRSPLVILDLTLGEQSGFSVLSELRGLDVEARVIAASGLMLPVEELLAAGFNAVLRKPLSLTDLYAAVDALAPQSAPSSRSR
jgi:CheY-like chemotaxis protein